MKHLFGKAFLVSALSLSALGFAAQPTEEGTNNQDPTTEELYRFSACCGTCEEEEGLQEEDSQTSEEETLKTLL